VGRDGERKAVRIDDGSHVDMLPRGCDSSGSIERSLTNACSAKRENTPEHPFRVKW